jgi:ankyrin repeat protein
MILNLHAITDLYLVVGCTPLICAIVDHDSTDLVEVLLKYRADPSMQDANGITPLDIAASLGKKKVAAIVLQSERDQLKAAH